MILFYGTGGVPGGGEIPMDPIRYRASDDFLFCILGSRKNEREKKAAGDAILGLCKSMTSPNPIPIGQYRGFDMELSFDTFSREYKITLIHQLRHTVTLGTEMSALQIMTRLRKNMGI